MRLASLAMGLTAAALAAAGCGSDEEPVEPSLPPVRSEAEPLLPTDSVSGSATATAPPAEDPESREPPGSTSPEDEPGGAGDEEAAAVDARFELGPAGFSPRKVSVPAFIGIALVVTPAEGQEYELDVRGPSAGAGGSGRGRFETSLEGLQPGARYNIRDRRSGARATIVADAEPGP